MAKRSPDHFALVRRGLQLHEARKYARALQHFEQACDLAPLCPTASYNRANTLHMLGNNEEAYQLLRGIVDASLENLTAGCPQCGARGLQSDACFLLALIVQFWRGDCEGALIYAGEHLSVGREGSSLFGRLKRFGRNWSRFVGGLKTPK
jgi:tetratricopeptide (TPR) repeat protein